MSSPSPLNTPSPQIKEEIALQKATVARLKKDILGVDRNARKRYIRDFHDEFSRIEGLSSFDDLVVACYKADVVYIGDYHALPASQEFASRLLREIAGRSREVVVCLEMVYARSQKILDRFMAGEIGEAEFLRGIRYDLDWGYDWSSFRRVFEVAREHRLAVFGIDSEPRSGLRYIRRRDAHAAARIADIAQGRPGAKIVVVIGESHLARNHLPRKVTADLKAKGLERRGVIVLQNLEEIYWQLAERGEEQVDVVTLGPGRFCHFNTSPLAKYEAYRQTIEVWKGEAEDQEDVDLTSTLYGMIDTILKFLRIDKYSHCVRRPGRSREFLVDAYPEVYSGLEEGELKHLLRGHRFTEAEVDEIAGHLSERGSCYIPRINAILIGQMNVVHAGEEAAHFINLALKGEIYDGAPREMPQHDLFYTGVLEEALGFFGSKLLDPSRNHFFETDLYQYYRKDRATIERETRFSYEDFNAIIDFILLHKKFEQNYAKYDEVPAQILAGIRAEPRRGNILIHELGYFLGQQIHDAYRAGVLDRREIARLFRRSFRASGSALKTYLDLTERVRPAIRSGSTPQPAATPD
ncbi:MAG: ChaN family lipoprotein [Acidobacteria bacterium]|nr:ChaN family lipoprotein [Acidobacteriota bacterium]